MNYNPYTWKALLRDGRTITRGGTIDGAEILSPAAIPKGMLAYLELVPTEVAAVDGWLRADIKLAAVETLVYAMTREQDVIGGVAQGNPRTVAVRLGKFKQDGTPEIMWLRPGGFKVNFPGSFEELLEGSSNAIFEIVTE